MYSKKYTPEEKLERIKLMMEYDLKKSLRENSNQILEQSSATAPVSNPKPVNQVKKKSEEEVIAREINAAAQGFGTDATGFVNATKKIKNAAQFWSINSFLKTISNDNLDFAGLVNDEMEDNNATEVSEIVNHLKKIGIGSTATIKGNSYGVNSFKITSAGTVQKPLDSKKIPNKKPVIKKPVVPTPAELKDSKGIMVFQDWLDKNKSGWATGYVGGVLNKQGGYGKFGPRTQKAWTSFKDEYLKGGQSTPTTSPETPEFSGEETTIDFNNKDF